MIPGPLFSIPMLLLLLAPWLAVAVSLWLLLRGLCWWQQRRKADPALRPRFWTGWTIALALLATAGDLWGLVLAYQLQAISHQGQLKTYYRESRQQFVLPQDFQYGELRVPKGSLVNRYDAFDNGEPQRPLGLRGLELVRFPAPVQVAGIWATALDARGGQLELARDQRIAPVLHFDAQAQDGYGAWVVDPARPSLDCKQGQIARFDVPLIDYDIQAEFSHPSPDGPQARFRPSQWRVIECLDSETPMTVLPPHTQSAPQDAQAMVWGPLRPASDD